MGAACAVHMFAFGGSTQSTLAHFQLIPPKEAVDTYTVVVSARSVNILDQNYFAHFV